VARQILIALTLLASSSVPSSHRAAPIAPANGAALSRDYFPEVRLRKLHLVRPDLIPYPISYEVYC
jgi:hypothetical protein